MYKIRNRIFSVEWKYVLPHNFQFTPIFLLPFNFICSLDIFSIFSRYRYYLRHFFYQGIVIRKTFLIWIRKISIEVIFKLRIYLCAIYFLGNKFHSTFGNYLKHFGTIVLLRIRKIRIHLKNQWIFGRYKWKFNFPSTLSNFFVFTIITNHMNIGTCTKWYITWFPWYNHSTW